MKILAVVLLITLTTMGCATTHLPMSPTPLPQPPPVVGDGPSAGAIIGTILLLPIIIPVVVLAAMVNSGYRSGYHGVSCKGKLYADGSKWKSICY